MTDKSVKHVGEFDRHFAAEQLRRSRHPIRRFVKNFYLRNILSDVLGPSIDFGCGAGQLLEHLPPGSVGIEELRSSGLKVIQARQEIQDFELIDFGDGSFRTLVIAHVLEHLPDPVTALRVLLGACLRLGIERVMVVVPGVKGFASDSTHKTFIERAYLETHMPKFIEGFGFSGLSYFPGPWEWVGRHFVFHELKIVFDRLSEPR